MARKTKHDLTPEQKAKAEAILNVHLTTGRIKVEKGEYIGEASDGEWVGFGDVFNIDGIRRYLFHNPKPTDW